jgi:hypothetical protein
MTSVNWLSQSRWKLIRKFALRHERLGGQNGPKWIGPVGVDYEISVTRAFQKLGTTESMAVLSAEWVNNNCNTVSAREASLTARGEKNLEDQETYKRDSSSISSSSAVLTPTRSQNPQKNKRRNRPSTINLNNNYLMHHLVHHLIKQLIHDHIILRILLLN